TDDPGLQTMEFGDRIEISTADVNSAVQRLIECGISLANLQIRARTLEDLFLELTGQELRP
ncbi:MAG: ABC transporter ATP-binding protein, partial [Gammaproteobacteria bacterium]